MNNGGSLENRMRFTLECIEAIKKNVPDTMPVLVKFTPHQRVEGFRTIDEGIEMAKILEEAGVDALHVDTGCYEEWFQAITTVYSKEGYKLDVQKAIKDIVSVPVLGDGNLKDPEVAKKAVEDGILDYVGLAHQMLADPYWPKKVKAHHEEDIAPCVGCNECLLAGFSGKHYYCAVNPLCYAEKAYALPLPNGQKRKVLVIGGGPAGMMAAITAKRRGFDVDLYEKEDKLGGTLWPAGGPDFKADVLKLIKYLETQCKKLDVNIHLNSPITKDNLEGDYDKVILAAGSTPAMPPIPGIDTTVLASDYLTHQATVGKKVVVIGAGLAGTEAACDIAGKDGDVTLVEMCPDILFTANHCLNNDQHLRKMVKDRGVKVEANAKVTNITPTSVTFERDGQTMTLECDTVLNAVGFRPNNQLEDLLDEKYDETLEIYNKSIWFGQSDGTIREKAAHMLNITLNLFQDMANNSEKELFSVIQEILECNREDQYQIWEKELFLDKNKIQLDELKEELLEWEEFPYEQQKALDKLICTLDKINETLQ